MKLGIDLGTTNTVVSTYSDGKLQPLKSFQMRSSSDRKDAILLAF